MNETYDLVIIGGGSAGLTAARFAAELGARVASIEKNRLGGECTWTGCIPSKTLLKSAKVAHYMRSADRFGIGSQQPTVDLRSVMAHVRSAVVRTYEEEKPEVLRADGIEVFLGAARYRDPHTLAVGETMLTARNVLLATGAHPLIPPVVGLDNVQYVTYESIWNLEVLPEHLLVIGSGPIGIEMAQGFRRLGSRVTMMISGERLFPRDEPEASRVLGEVFESEGIYMRFDARAERAWQDENGTHVMAGGQELVGDTLLVSVGRRPNVEGLDLEKAGVNYSAKGIEVDNRLRTSQRHLCAVGGCIGRYQFTHVAGGQAVIAARNALLPGTMKGVRDWVPWTTFTDPEVAHAGLTEKQARESHGDAVTVSVLPMSQVDRARAEVDSSGLVKLIGEKNGSLLGVTIVNARAGEIIHEWIAALEHRLKVRDLATMVRIYLTYSMANMKAAGALLQEKLLSGAMGQVIRSLGLLSLRWMRWRRGF